MQEQKSIIDYILEELGLTRPIPNREDIYAVRMVAAMNLGRTTAKYANLGTLMRPSEELAEPIYAFIKEIALRGERGYSLENTRSAISMLIEEMIESEDDFDSYDTERRWRAFLPMLKRTFPLLQVELFQIPLPLGEEAQ